jgi:hypothetical protein
MLQSVTLQHTHTQIYRLQPLPNLCNTCVAEGPAQVGIKYTLCWTMCVCVYTAVHLKSKLELIGNWSAAAWPARRLCYRPAVFFHHLQSLPWHSHKEKIRWAFKIVTWFSVFNYYGPVWHESAWRWGVSVCVYTANSRHCSSTVPRSWSARGLGNFVLSCVKYWYKENCCLD